MKKNILLLILLILITTIIIGCKSKKPPEESTPINTSNNEFEEIETKPDDPFKGKALNPLTGMYIEEKIANRRPVGVMINNLKKALPQSGIGQADIIYETIVEGGICRLFAIFQEFDAKKIGPIRSARHYYLDFAFDHDAIYAHYGKSPQALAAFANWNSPHMDGLSYLDDIMCFVDSSRVRPHNRYTSYNGLMAAWEDKGYRKELNDSDFKFNFYNVEYIPELGNVANKLTLPFSYYQTSWFEYNSNDRLYYRFQFNDKHIDKETGEQLKFKNIIVQFVNIWTIPNDSEGRQDMNLITTGEGYYLTNGVLIPITWEKSSHYSPTHYYLEDGSELKMNAGKTWVAVFPKSRKEKIIID